MRPPALTWVLVGVAAAVAARRWLDVVEVRGNSMAPTLVPGDRLLVERLSYRLRAPRVGDVVLAADPRTPRRELVKRVALINGEAVTLIGDNRSASTDSLAFGEVSRGAIAWRVVVRYARAPPRSERYSVSESVGCCGPGRRGSAGRRTGTGVELGGSPTMTVFPEEPASC